MNFRSTLKQESVGFQIAPMIDIVFLLLCFFVTSQIFAQWETEIDITLPTAKRKLGFTFGNSHERHKINFLVWFHSAAQEFELPIRSPGNI